MCPSLYSKIANTTCIYIKNYDLISGFLNVMIYYLCFKKINYGQVEKIQCLNNFRNLRIIDNIGTKINLVSNIWIHILVTKL